MVFVLQAEAQLRWFSVFVKFFQLTGSIHLQYLGENVVENSGGKKKKSNVRTAMYITKKRGVKKFLKLQIQRWTKIKYKNLYFLR